MPPRTRPLPAFYTPEADMESLPLPVAQTELIPELHILPVAQQELPIVDHPKKASHRKAPYAKKLIKRRGFGLSPDCDVTTPNPALVGPGLIPKLDGQPGKPNNGGYNLENALTPDLPNFKKINAYVKDLVDIDLDGTQTITRQSAAGLKVVENKCLAKYPELNKFEDCWAVTAMLSARLHTTSQIARNALKAQQWAAGGNGPLTYNRSTRPIASRSGSRD